MEISNDDIEMIDDSTDDDDRPSPPEAAVRFAWGYRTLHNVEYSEAWEEDPHFELPDGLDAEVFEDGHRVDFEKGDPIPRAVAEEVWSAFSDHIVAYDEAGEVVSDVSVGGLSFDIPG